MGRMISTIGFSKKSLRHFISLLKESGVTRLVDTRLHNTSQLSGFAKKQDLEYILELVHIDYVHCPTLAPTDDILKHYKKKEISWEQYEQDYLKLIKKREILPLVKRLMDGEHICLLCSEHESEHCHRRLLAEYVQESIDDTTIHHL
ncbi:DUF488 family protein [Alkalihalobacillus pseudalcaliphilus]|uniref:DUF488 domain-containing protein n=1 Tax=Alkalihalobacillus pseudalcaliphilus TaxID=79884 RepID=UPI00064DC6B6|nr:DUF488 domain-containing protein [Alkalihalobacillus pseudalcaliphilus]KMK77368.1 hypothetical protein AB990_02465 [Alkalihalobacillus pseudalcaliphilus]